jgi:hypothetical protein
MKSPHYHPIVPLLLIVLPWIAIVRVIHHFK